MTLVSIEAPAVPAASWRQLIQPDTPNLRSGKEQPHGQVEEEAGGGVDQQRHRLNQNMDPTNRGFLESPLSVAFEPGCGILMFLWAFGRLGALLSRKSGFKAASLVYVG